ncbi:MAG: hypothetical protein AB2A00_18340 [Myxococcota bacterium]
MSHFNVMRRAAWAGLLVGALDPSRALAAMPCDATDDVPCTFQIQQLELQPVPQTFKFQARVSQAKLPIGDGLFNKVIVNLKSADEVLCAEEFSNVRVTGSVINLEVGRNMSCELDQVIAENHDLFFQICIGGTENCLRPIALGTTPYAVKSTFASQAGTAHSSDVAAQANYTHRATADRDLFITKEIGHGYFDFATPDAAPDLYNDTDFVQYAGGGFLQWTPLNEANPTLNVCAKDPLTDRPKPLDQLMLNSNVTRTTGRLDVLSGGAHVIGASEVTGNTVIRGQLKVDLPVGPGPRGAHVTGDSSITGALVVTAGETINAGGLLVQGGGSNVTGNSIFHNHLDVYGTSDFDGTMTTNDIVSRTGITVQNGGVTVQNGGATITGNESLSGSLTVGGTSTLAGALTVNNNGTVTGNLNIGGATTSNGPLTVNNNAWVTGVLTAQSIVGDTTFFNSQQTFGNNTVWGVSTLVGPVFGNTAVFNGDVRVNGRFISNNNEMGGVTADFLVGNNLTVNGNYFQRGADFVFTNLPGRGDGGRALVHEVGDVLAINFAGDFTNVRVDSDIYMQRSSFTQLDHWVRQNFIVRGDWYMEGNGNGDGGLAFHHGGGDTLYINVFNSLSGGTVIDSSLTVTGNATTYGRLTSNDIVTNQYYMGGGGGRAMSLGGGDTLVINAGGDHGGGTRIEGFELNFAGADFRMGYAPRGAGGRALVHGGGNELIISFGGDFSSIKTSSVLVPEAGLDLRGHGYSVAGALDWGSFDIYVRTNPGAICAAGYHPCTAWEAMVLDTLSDKPLFSNLGWTVGSFPNLEFHQRSLVNGQDSVVCPAGSHISKYPSTFTLNGATYTGGLHCVADGTLQGWQCCRNKR